MLKDKRVKEPQKHCIEISSDIILMLEKYGLDQIDRKIELCNYVATDVIQGVIIDITADQFGEASVYVGYMGDFYKQFVFVNAHKHEGLGNARLETLYNTVIDFIR